MKNPKNNCGHNNYGSYTSSSTGKVSRYCKTCQRVRAQNYNLRRKNADGKHNKQEWLNLLSRYDSCPICKRKWSEIPSRPNKRYKYVWTKDHIIPLNSGGKDSIDNIQPLCYQCNFGKR